MGLTHIEYLDADEVAYRFGWLGPSVIAAKYDPTAGWLDSNALIHRFAQSTQSSTHSARILLGMRDVQVCVEGGRVTGVKLPDSAISAPKVIIAAGAGAVAGAAKARVNLTNRHP